MAAKKTTKKSPSRAGRATTTSKTTVKETKNKKTTSSPASNKSNTKKVATPAKKTSTGKGRGGATREMDPVTGFAPGTDSHLIAEALLEGGESRQSIIDHLRDNVLDPETRTGSEKPVANIVAGTINKMLDRGFTIESSFQLVEPTPASKRAAAKAVAARESQPKRGPGRPPRNPAPAKKGRKPAAAKKGAKKGAKK